MDESGFWLLVIGIGILYALEWPQKLWRAWRNRRRRKRDAKRWRIEEARRQQEEAYRRREQGREAAEAERRERARLAELKQILKVD